MALQAAKSRVCINGSCAEKNDPVYGLKRAARLLPPFCSKPQIDGNSFPQDPALRTFDSEGWFSEVEPFSKQTDEWVSPRSFFRECQTFLIASARQQLLLFGAQKE